MPVSWDSSNIAELNSVEKDVLKHIAGYVVSRVKSNDKTCSRCSDFIMHPDQSTLNKTEMLYFKNFVPEKLIRITDDCFNSFLMAEKVFRSIENSLRVEQNVTTYVIQTLLDNVTFQSDIPNCHNLKQKLISRFVSF